MPRVTYATVQKALEPLGLTLVGVGFERSVGRVTIKATLPEPKPRPETNVLSYEDYVARLDSGDV